MRLLYVALLILLLNCVAAHDDYLPLKQPLVIASPCVQRWRDMAAHFQANGTRSRPLSFESVPSELHVNLTVAMERFESRYVGFNTRTYNGNVPAPTIQVCPGDKLVLHVTNDLGDGDANATNVHLHGLHVSPKGRADNVLMDIAPGAARVYEYEIRADHPSGTFWYHPHTHGIVNTQLSGLMAGALVVVDRPGDFPQEIAQMDDLVLILQAICVENCHTTFDCIVNALKNKYDNGSMAHMDMDNGMEMDDSEDSDEVFPVDLRVDRNSPLNDTSLLHAYVNGQYLPEVHMKPSEFKRFRYINAIANNVAELVAPDCEMHVLAMDGIYWKAPEQREVVVIPPGGRADLAVRCKAAGTFFMETESSSKRNHLLGKMNQHRVPSQKVVSLRVLGDETLSMSLPQALPQLPAYMQNSIEAAVPATHRYNYEFSVWMDESNAMVYGVNKQQFHHKFVNHSMRVDEPQHWALSVRNYGMHDKCDETPLAELERQQNINFSTEKHLLALQPGVATQIAAGAKDMKHGCHTMNHPFHMHSSHFQVTHRRADADPENVLFSVGEWRDTIPLFKTPVEIRFTPRDHMVGRVLTHCHVASHADGGMAQLIEVLPAKEQ